MKHARERPGLYISIPIAVGSALLAMFGAWRVEVFAIFAVGFAMHPLLEIDLISHVGRVIERDVGRIRNVADSFLETDWKRLRDDIKALNEWRRDRVDPALDAFAKAKKGNEP